ncbi:MKI67 FHA domain-interacting nucleolar phosphoprotein [Diachasma alloeum]|uniref:MKI67 FHA domain-interacting nucleolar phosphoprotein n=1 Tax=Diachasma alloeum TaxID=454923 RepID=UPI0007384839|nr:MKI67 FHA domain-interacting nucleolar phosphoprotein [Diachasma alloeum]
MKTRRDRKQKPALKVKKESKTGESTLKKAVKNVKEILKKETKKKVNAVVKKETKAVLKRPAKTEKKDEKAKRRTQDFIRVDRTKGKKQIKKASVKKEPGDVAQSGRGLIYIGHIPHGFYEEQMKDYFSQFGKVTRVRVSRSKITGRSKGYGYVEFVHPEVAKIAAESMNNYLMSGRLVKAEYIPPEKQHEHYFKGSNWKIGGHPKLKTRMKAIRIANAPRPNSEHKKFVQKTVSKLSKLSQLLKNEGIDFKMKLGDVEI